MCSKFALWCTRRDLDPSRPSVSRVCDFSLFLFVHDRLLFLSIEGYRSAINSVWGAAGRSLEESCHVTRLLKSFRVDRPCSSITSPFSRWDLNLVFRVLTLPSFHPTDDWHPFCLSMKRSSFFCRRRPVVGVTSTPST